MITGICIHMGIQQLPRTILEICFVDPQIVWGLSQKRRQKRSKTTNSLTPLVPNAQSMDYAHQIYRYTDIQIYRYSPRNELFYFPSPRGLSMLRAWITHTAILYAKTKFCFSKRDLQRKHDDCLLIISLLQYARETYILVNQTYSSVQETHISVKETYTSVKATCISLSVKQSCISISYISVSKWPAYDNHTCVQPPNASILNNVQSIHASHTYISYHQTISATCGQSSNASILNSVQIAWKKFGKASVVTG